MKFFATITTAALIGLAIAAPTKDTTQTTRRRCRGRSYNGGITSNDLENGDSANCPAAILIYARGSTEDGNMGASVGPNLANGIKGLVRSLWVQGVGGGYAATLPDNALPRGSSPAGIEEGVRLINLAHQKCPNSAILASGYSQGSALMAAAIEDVDEAARGQIKGAVMFGYTKNQQNDGGIPSFPQDRTLIVCAEGDLVCDGTLIVAPAHLTYGGNTGTGAKFLASKV